MSEENSFGNQMGDDDEEEIFQVEGAPDGEMPQFPSVKQQKAAISLLYKSLGKHSKKDSPTYVATKLIIKELMKRGLSKKVARLCVFEMSEVIVSDKAFKDKKFFKRCVENFADFIVNTKKKYYRDFGKKDGEQLLYQSCSQLQFQLRFIEPPTE
jgi:hypothetical protein